MKSVRSGYTDMLNTSSVCLFPICILLHQKYIYSIDGVNGDQEICSGKTRILPSTIRSSSLLVPGNINSHRPLTSFNALMTSSSAIGLLSALTFFRAVESIPVNDTPKAFEIVPATGMLLPSADSSSRVH